MQYPLLFDGAFGTYYAQLSGRDTPCELANLDDPGMVRRIHGEYIAAGAQAIKTNTFAANTQSLGMPFERVGDVLRAGYHLATQCAQGRPVFADIGPIQPQDDAEDVQPQYRAIEETFLQAGARCFLLETFANTQEPLAAAAYIRQKMPQAYIAVLFAVDADGFSRQGEFFGDMIARAQGSGLVDATGLNCICGPMHMRRLIRRLPTGSVLGALPNAGYATTAGGRLVYQDNAQYFARQIGHMAEAGAKILGGCCGTTPEHIRLAAQALRAAGPVRVDAGDGMACEAARPSPLQVLLQGERRVIVAELDPPSLADWGAMTDKARSLGVAGADMITVADSPLARARADSVICALRIHRETGLPVLPHITCRDKNPLALRASLLGAAMEGVQDILAITGDPVAPVDRQAKGVFAFNSAGMMGHIAGLNADIFAGQPFGYCGALNINAPNFDAELKRAARKAGAGASALLTQPAFSDQAVENLRAAHLALDIPVLLGLYPLAGHRNAVFMQNEVPGIDIPADVVDSFAGLNQAQSRERAVAFCMEIAQSAAPYCRGYYIMTPMRRVKAACQLIEQLRRTDI